MSDLLQLLRDEAVTLVESDLPSSEELRSVVGALVNRVERFETQVVGELKPAPAVPEPSVPTELEQAQSELAAAQAKVAALEQPSASAAPSTAGSTSAPAAQ